MSMNCEGISGGIAGVWEGPGVIEGLEIPPALDWLLSELQAKKSNG